MLLAELSPNKIVYLCDTFSGMPYSNPEIGDIHGIGSFDNCSVYEIKDRLKRYYNIRVLEGIFPNDTFKFVNDEKFCLVHLDVDVYQSYKDCLETLYDMVVPSGLIVFDDYGIGGATKAIDEFFSNKKETIECNNDEFYIRKI